MQEKKDNQIQAMDDDDLENVAGGRVAYNLKTNKFDVIVVTGISSNGTKQGTVAYSFDTLEEAKKVDQALNGHLPKAWR